MKTYQVEITEVLQKIVSIDASNEEEAIRMIREKYQQEAIILNDSHLIDVEFKVNAN